MANADCFTRDYELIMAIAARTLRPMRVAEHDIEDVGHDVAARIW